MDGAIARRTRDGLQLPEGTSVISQDVAHTAGERPLLLLETYVNPCPGNAGWCKDDRTQQTSGRGLVARDLRTGALAWQRLVMPPVPRNDPAAERIEDAGVAVVGHTRDLVVVAVGPLGSIDPRPASNPERRRALTTTIALRASDGAKVWRVERFAAQRVQSGLVLGHRPFTVSGRGWGHPCALDAATGQEVRIDGLSETAGGGWFVGIGVGAPGDSVLIGDRRRAGFSWVDLVEPEPWQVFERYVQTDSGVSTKGPAQVYRWER